MHSAKLLRLEARLESQVPLIAGCLRQRAAQALTRDGSPEAVRVLALAVTRSDDRQVLAIALDALRQIKKQQCIDKVCAIWAITRHKNLANLLTKKGWVALAPADVKVLSALKANQHLVITKGGVEIVAPLLQAFSDADPEIASRASQWATALTNPDLVNYLCQQWLNTRDRLLEQVILQGKYVARQPVEVRVLSALKVNQHLVITKGGVEIVAPLLQAFSDADPEIASRASQWATALTNPDLVNYLCQQWLNTRDRLLEQVILQGKYVARQPVEVRVLSALKVRKLEAVISGGAEVVEPLLQACKDVDNDIAREGHLALRKLKNPEAQDLLCGLVIEQDERLAREVAVESQYAPCDPNKRALFFFLTEQWDKYESLDFEQTLLQLEYELGDEQLRQRIAQKARQSGRGEWVRIIVGGRNGQRLGKMTDADWEMALVSLSHKQQWEEMWRLAQSAPPIWSRELLQRLLGAGWIPQTEMAELVRLGQRCVAEVPGMWSCGARLKHTDYVRGLAISPDSKLLASGSGDKTVRLWSLPDGQLLQTLYGHTQSVSGLAISPGGKLLASGSGDKTVRLWSLPDGQLLQTLYGHTQSVWSLAISPDGKLLASGSQDKTIRLWSLPDGQLLQTLYGHTQSVWSLAISPDGKLLASGNGDQTIRLWSLPDGNRLQTLYGHTAAVYDLAISPDGKLLASGSQDKRVRLWSLPNGNRLQTVYGHTNAVWDLAISPDGKLLASGSSDKTVRLRSLPDGQLLQILKGHTNAVWDLAISPDGKLLASGGHDKTVRLWIWTLHPVLHRLSRLPVEQMSTEDMHWVQEAIQNTELSEPQRVWLEFILALMQWRRRFDVEVEETSQQIAAGKFDIEISG